MTSRVVSLDAAFAVLGVAPVDGVAAARAAFRSRVKRLHPDVTPPTQATLTELARIVAAMDYIRANAPVALEVEISAAQAARGLTRTLRHGDKPLLVRIPAGTRDGTGLTAVGEDRISVTIRVQAEGETVTPAPPDFPDAADLDAFMHEFSRPSVTTRLARWIRKAQSAA
ncbi:hypothetical protein AWH62_11010 [Maricaulis sp. W15]|uniref:hypothetical protein n=1 Tax=Maricaulis sp. W15 TaxID=1772333 RepID=UPI000948DC0D|nr:hypothetical protein [Maricaulis sp. W15]OLF72352.1 hypothetical protein AWH62_11010 [Maricaulis sp. W15]